MGWFGILPDALQLSQAVTILGHTHTSQSVLRMCSSESVWNLDASSIRNHAINGRKLHPRNNSFTGNGRVVSLEIGSGQRVLINVCSDFDSKYGQADPNMDVKARVVVL